MSPKAAKTEAPAADARPVLPLPAVVLEHHGQALFGPMREWQASGKLPPVLLLTGLPGVGKRSLTHYLAQWVLCERSGMNRREEEAGADLFGGSEPAPAATPSIHPCGECPSCLRAAHGGWIDFTEIGAESGEDADGALKIEQFRKLKSTQGFGAHEGRYRFILINGADRMTVPAANSVLKLLEEPPAGWIFILTASDPTLLLPTIVSRCQQLRLRPFPVPALERLLADAGIEPARRAICARLGEGSWGGSLAWADERIWEQRRGIVDFLKEPAASLNQLVDWAAQEPRNLDRMIDQLESLTADLIRWSLAVSPEKPENYPWLNADAKTVLAGRAKAAAKDPSRARDIWIARASALAEARSRLHIPLNRKLFAQDLLIPWL